MKNFYIVPEPKHLEFDGTWYDFDGFQNFPEFLAKEFSVAKGSWIIEKSSGMGTGLRIEKGVVRIWGDERIAYATILQLVLQGRDKLPSVRVVEEFRYAFRGFHLDVARGGVPTVDALKKLLKWLYLLKYNYLALYLEDLFPWEKYRDIGVVRGRYSRDELKEVIEYGKKLGVEVIPSLELLGHMENILVLPPYRKYSEWHNPREGVLDASDEEARNFAKELLQEVVEFFPSQYIHIGGDETWALGRGRSLDKTNTFRGPEIYEKHMKMLIDVVKSYGKKPMLWGDMITASYLKESEKEIWRKILESKIWREAIIVNWDYTPSPVEHFKHSIRVIGDRGLKQIIAPGLWNWSRFYPDFLTALENLRNFFEAAKNDSSVEGFLITAWGDDGSECLFQYLYPLILAAMEIAEGVGKWEEKWLALTGESREVLEIRKWFGKIFSAKDEYWTRWGFWLPKHIALKTEDMKIAKMYLDKSVVDSMRREIEEVVKMAELINLPKELEFVKEFYKLVLKVLDGRETASDYIALAKMYIELWLSERKPQGLETVVGKFWRAAGVTEMERSLLSKPH
ncbi:MAG: beta-N-acetylhexosaminidase [Ignisphaera sp.]